MKKILKEKIDSLTKASKITLLTYSNQVISMIVLFVEGKILTTSMNMDDYGAYNQVLTTVSLVSMVLCLNLGHGFIRFASGYSRKKKTQTFHTVLLTQTFLYFIACVLALPFYESISLFIIGKNSIYVICFVGVLTLLSGGISNIQNYLLVTGKDECMIRQNLYRTIIDVLFIIFFVKWLPHIWGALIGYASGELLCFVLFSVVNHIDYSHIKIDTALLKELLKFSLPLLITSVAYWVINSSNRYFINYYCGLDAVGQFSIANKLPVTIVTLFLLLSTIFLSNTSRLYDEGNIDRVSYWFVKIIKVFIIFSVPGAVLLISCHRAMTLILSTSDYLFNDIAQFYLLLCLGNVLFGLFLIISKIYDLGKKVKEISRIWAIILATNIILNFTLIPSFGLLGSAWATVITYFMGLVFAFFCRPRIIYLNINWIKLYTYIITSLLFAFIYSTATINENLSPIIEVLMAIALAFMSFMFGVRFKVVKVEELKELVYK